MKHYIYILLPFLLAACRQEDPMTFRGEARVQLADTTTSRHTFVYSPATVSRDTLYVQVNTIGETSPRDRQVTLVQVAEYITTITTDPVTGEPDTLVTERPNAAVPGVHHVALDDPAVRAIVPANAVTARVPVILLRDASLKAADYRLRLKIVESDDFKPGEKAAIERAIIIADRLVQPAFWDQNVLYTFGTYSARKHQFMIDVSGERVDNEWYDTRVRNITGAAQQWKNLFKTALAAFNNDPANIASGVAPLRETDDPASPLVSFPA